MKNKIKIFTLFILINLFITSNLVSNEINFEANSIELIDKDNKIIAKKNVKIFNQNETIYANEMDYDKSKQIIKAKGDIRIENLDDKQKFIDTYTYVTEESFVGVKRYSSLMPREVLTEVFNNKSGSEITVTASNGDKYIIDINKFYPPDDSEIENILNEYTSFSENVLMTKMSQIINQDVFDKARVNLSNLAL